MASSSEIEKLERRYAENPEGRFFAPLADAYRKAGHVDRAVELVRAGLEKHPDYLSAHIVLGRCLLDKGNDVDASQTFQAVLGFDAENIIALKSLAEISERGGRVDEAREWLQKLLVVDSMNADAEADLMRLGGPIAAQPSQPAEGIAVEAAPPPETSFADVAMEMQAEPVAAAATEAPGPVPQPPAPPSFAEMPTQPMEALPVEWPAEPPIEAVSQTPEPALAAPEMLPPPAPPEPAAEPTPEAAAPASIDLLPFDDSLAWGTGERSSRAVRIEDIAAVVHDDTVTTPAIEFLSDIESATSAAPPAPPPAEPAPLPAMDFSIEEPPDQTFGAAEPEAPLPSNVELPANLSGAYSIVDEVPESAPVVPAGPSDLPLIMPEDVTPAEELARPSAKQVQMVSPPPPEEPAAAAEPMVTETMGDLYLKQGFRSEAADVYRRLLSQRPDDPSLASKLRSLEGPPPDLSAAAQGAESVGAWLRRVAASRIGSPLAGDAPETLHPTPDTLSPLEAAFAAPPGEAPGEPAHPAREAFSLDQIFGSAPEAPSSSVGAPSAGPSPTTAPPPPGASFDEFFGTPPEHGSVRPATGAPDQPAPAGEEDISAFSAWLQGLKK
jgi:tetratricopeptide (TPR) repeat protein